MATRLKKTRIQAAAADQDWLDNARSTFIKVGFEIKTTKPMNQLLCSIAAGVKWDAFRNGSGALTRENYATTHIALVKRGLIYHPAGHDTKWHYDQLKANGGNRMYFTGWVLSPAGKLLVQFFKVLGVFVEADAAIEKTVASILSRRRTPPPAGRVKPKRPNRPPANRVDRTKRKRR